MKIGREPKKKAAEFIKTFADQYAKSEIAKKIPEGTFLVDRKALEGVYLAGYGAAETKDIPAHLVKI